MSKKYRKRCKKKKRKAKVQVKSLYDRHHLLWTRRSWEKGALRKLRLHPYCIVVLHRDTLHQYIHAKMTDIPVPKTSSVKAVLDHLALLEGYGAIGSNDPIEKRLNVLAALFDCMEQPTADALREQLRIVREFNYPP